MILEKPTAVTRILTINAIRTKFTKIQRNSYYQASWMVKMEAVFVMDRPELENFHNGNDFVHFLRQKFLRETCFFFVNGLKYEVRSEIIKIGESYNFFSQMIKF